MIDWAKMIREEKEKMGLEGVMEDGRFRRV
jgi:hypothetical protein